MELSKQSIEEFKQIYIEDYGIELTDEEAYEEAHRAFALINTIFRGHS